MGLHALLMTVGGGGTVEVQKQIVKLDKLYSPSEDD